MGSEHSNCGCQRKCDCNCETQISCDLAKITDKSYFYLYIEEDCKSKFIEFSAICFKDWIVQEVTQGSSFVTNALFLTYQQTVTDQFNTVNQAINDLNAAIGNLTIPDVSSFVTMEQVCDKIDERLNDYYTTSQVDSIVANIQSQLTTISEQLANLQDQLNACDCDGGGGNTTTAPTLSSTFDNFTENICPQEQTRTVTNPDNFNFCVENTGDGTMEVLVDGTSIPETEWAGFSIPDGADLTTSITGADGAQVVGGVNLSFIDGSGDKQNIDGFNYNVTCPNDGGGNSLTLVSCPSHGEISFSGNQSSSAIAGPYTVEVSGGSGNYVLSQTGVFIQGVVFEETSTALGLSYRWVATNAQAGGPENYVLTVTDTETNETVTCEPGSITVTGVIN